MKRDKGGRKEEKEGGRGQVGMEGDGRGGERKRDVRKEAIAVEGGRDQLISVKMRISLCHMGFSPPSFFSSFFFYSLLAHSAFIFILFPVAALATAGFVCMSRACLCIWLYVHTCLRVCALVLLSL